MLHRDLKPANVMLDGRGRVRITDFGLAALATDISGADIRSGTPQYMSPEQLEGSEVSIRSDIYALGLVLYEVFTGKPAFEADTAEEFRRMHLEEQPVAMGSMVSEIDPAIERILERCLEKDPQRRPPTVSAVALALPGGDPLAAALALGDTPSPELVASAGGGVRLRPLWGLLLMMLFLSGLWIESVGKGARSLVDHVNLDRAGAAQEERARTLIAELGFTTPPVDSYGSYESRRDVLRWISDNSGSDWTRIEDSWPSALVYWYRQDADWLAPQNADQLVTRSDPPPGRPGSMEVVLSHRGDLQSLRATPGPGETRGEPGLDPEELDRLLIAAGLDPDAFEFVEGSWTPTGFADRTAILRGPDPTGSPLELRVASLGGKISEFTIAGPWDRPTPPARNRPGDAFVLVVLLVVLGFASVMSFRNLREGRVDPRSTARVTATVLALPILAWIIRGHHPPLAQTTLTGFLRAFSEGALFGVFCLALYLAVEPVLRRVWPQMLISWTRATTGGFSGPTVGTALLAGAAGFAVAVWINQLTGSLRIFTSRAVLPAEIEWIALGSTGGMLGILSDQFPVQLFTALLYTTVLVLLRMVTRSRVIASIGFVIIIGIIMTATGSGKQFGLTTGLLTAALWLALLLRAGLLALVTAKILVAVFLRFPVTTDLTQIHGTASVLLLVLVVVLMTWALFQAVGGRQLVDERRAETLG
jgi:serine/threonine-protein kinase